MCVGGGGGIYLKEGDISKELLVPTRSLLARGSLGRTICFHKNFDLFVLEGGFTVKSVTSVKNCWCQLALSSLEGACFHEDCHLFVLGGIYCKEGDISKEWLVPIPSLLARGSFEVNNCPWQRLTAEARAPNPLWGGLRGSCDISSVVISGSRSVFATEPKSLTPSNNSSRAA